LDPGETDNGGSPTAVAEGAEPAENSQQAPAKGDETVLSETEVMSKIAHDILKKSESQTDDADKQEGSDVQEKDTTDDEDAAESGEAEDDESEDAASDEKGPVPYKRFEEVVGERKKLEEQTKQWEPLVMAQQLINETLNSAGVSLEEFQNIVDVLALSKSDPEAALVKLKPLLTELNQFAEDAVPAEIQTKINGLAERVKDGELSQSAADELQAAWLEQVKVSRKVKLNEKKGQMTEVQRQQAYVQSFVNAASDWGNTKMKSDPDYRPKAKADAADGLHELTEAFFTRGLASTKLKSPQDLVGLLEKSYASAKAILAPKRNGATKPVPTSRGATAVSQPKAKTLSEVAARVAAKHGISYTPRPS
jgi:hypothetical protein